MKKQQTDLLQNIEQILQQQMLLLQKAKTPQQQFFQLYAHRFMLTKDMLHKNIQTVLRYSPGCFAQKDLECEYITLCMLSQMQLDGKQFPLYKFFKDWKGYVQHLQQKGTCVKLDKIIMQQSQFEFKSYEQYLAYLDFIAFDLLQIIMGNVTAKDIDEKSFQVADLIDLSQIETRFSLEQLLIFAKESLPKIMFNIILQQDDLPFELKKNKRNMQCLFINRSWQYFVRFNDNYAILIRTVIKIIMKGKLPPSLQKVVMHVVFKYFYAFHHDKMYKALELFAYAFNWLDQSTKFAMTDQFILFLRNADKIGKSKFVDFVKEKSEWIADIVEKIGDTNIMGDQKERLIPFNLMGISQKLIIDSGKTQSRTFQVLQQYSLIYFTFSLQSQDITIKFFYLGDIISPQPTIKQLASYSNVTTGLSKCIIAIQRGLYMLQFDNSYSWIHKKVVRFDYVVMSPLHIKSQHCFKWIKAFYSNVVLNQVSNKKAIHLLKKVQFQREQIVDGSANILKNGTLLKFDISLIYKGKTIQYETDNQKRFVQKVIANAKKYNIQWLINNEVIEDINNIQMQLKRFDQEATAFVKPKPNKKEKQQKEKQQKTSPKNEDPNEVIPAYSQKEEREEKEKEDLRKLIMQIPQPEVKMVKKKIQRKKIVKQTENE